MKTMSTAQKARFNSLIRDVGLAGVLQAVQDRVDLKVSGEGVPEHHPKREDLVNAWSEFRKGLDSAVEAAEELEAIEQRI